jgi:small subunit ribosomal protein S8
MMTDTLADMLTRIRNANFIERPAVDMPASRLKVAVAEVLKEEGFILDFQVGTSQTSAEGVTSLEPTTDLGQPRVVLRVYLKYGPEGEKVIRHLARASTPGRRLYRRASQLRPVLDGLGISIISTSKGVMSDRKARTQRLGGELLCTVW